jgi:hypothetical protein
MDTLAYLNITLPPKGNPQDYETLAKKYNQQKRGRAIYDW